MMPNWKRSSFVVEEFSTWQYQQLSFIVNLFLLLIYFYCFKVKNLLEVNLYFYEKDMPISLLDVNFISPIMFDCIIYTNNDFPLYY